MKERGDIAVQVVSLFLLAFLCLQMTRVYIVTQTDAYTCASSDHHAFGAISHDDHAHVALGASLPMPDDGRNYITHCKDTLDSNGLIPIVLFGPPNGTSAYTARVRWLNEIAPSLLMPSGHFPRTFQPPRLFS